MKAETYKFVNLELTEVEVDGLCWALSNALGVLKPGIESSKAVRVSIPEVDIERLEKLYEVLDDVREI